MRRTLFLIWKEFLELRQDRRILGIVLIGPVLQLILLGYAATTDVTNVPVVVADGDRSAGSRDLIARFEASPYFAIRDVVTTTGEIDRYLERGLAWMAVSIPPGFDRRVRRGLPTVVQIVADGTDANSANVGLGYATALIGRYGAELAVARGAAAPGIDMRIRIWFNPRLESKDFMIPGVLALILMMMTAVLSSMAIVREKENGTLEQLNVTPISRWNLIAGKLLPYAIIGAVDVLLVLAVAVLWFEVPLRGSPALLIGLSGVYLLTTLGIGLFVSTVSRTQQQAMMTATFFFMVPMLYLSGFIFPIENMPEVIQPVTYLIPLRYYLVIVRGLFLKGVGLDVLWPQALALLGWGLGILALAVARSSKRLA